jgi:hypothetical protein
LTLDDDVAEALAAEARRRRRTYREVVNDVIRRGLARPPEGVRFQVAATAMQRRPGVDIDDIEGLLDLLEGPARR